MFIYVHTNVMFEDLVHMNVIFEDLRKYYKKYLKNIFHKISVNHIRMWKENCAQLDGEI